MIITTGTGQSFDTEKDLTSAERHVLQKLMLWQSMVHSLEEFTEKVDRALKLGWNDSGPVRASHALAMIIKSLEEQVACRFDGS
jgi:hypothetical protein